MANAEYERALARARLALIAPTVDDVTAAYFDRQVEKVLQEAKHSHFCGANSCMVARHLLWR